MPKYRLSEDLIIPKGIEVSLELVDDDQPGPEPSPSGHFDIIPKGTDDELGYIRAPDGRPWTGMGYNLCFPWNSAWQDSWGPTYGDPKTAHKASLAHAVEAGATMARVVSFTGRQNVYANASDSWWDPKDMWSIRDGAMATQRELVMAGADAGFDAIVLTMADILGGGLAEGIPAAREGIMEHWMSGPMVALIKEMYPRLWVNIACEDVWLHPTAKLPNGNPAPDYRGWADWYTKAVQRLRNAGIESVIVIDGGSVFAQDPECLLEAGRRIYDEDPLGRVLLSIHCYSFWRNLPEDVPAGWPLGPWSFAPMFRQLALEVGLPIYIGEFGAGGIGNDTPYNTQLLVQRATRHNFPTTFWLWYEGNPAYQAVRDMADPSTLTATGQFLSSFHKANARRYER